MGLLNVTGGVCLFLEIFVVINDVMCWKSSLICDFWIPPCLFLFIGIFALAGYRRLLCVVSMNVFSDLQME